MAARKKRKITKAHLRALQAGRKRYQREQKQAKNPKRKRTAKRTAKKSKSNPIRKHPRKQGWWLFRSRNGDCRLGYGTHAAALRQGQRISDRTQQELDMTGPFKTRQDASRLCA